MCVYPSAMSPQTLKGWHLRHPSIPGTHSAHVGPCKQLEPNKCVLSGGRTEGTVPRAMRFHKAWGHWGWRWASNAEPSFPEAVSPTDPYRPDSLGGWAAFSSGGHGQGGPAAAEVGETPGSRPGEGLYIHQNLKQKPRSRLSARLWLLW